MTKDWTQSEWMQELPKEGIKVGEEAELVGITKEEWMKMNNDKILLNDIKSAFREVVKKLLQVKPELKAWIDKNYGEYL